MGLFECVCHPGEYGAHVPPWGLELADHLLNLARNDDRQDRLMADITTALADLDGLLGDLVETDISDLRSHASDNGDARVQAIADEIEAKVARARGTVATAPTPSTPQAPDAGSVTDPASSTPVVDPAGGQTAPAPTGDGTVTPPAVDPTTGPTA